MLLAPTPAPASGIEHDQRRHERAAVADRARLADERDHLELGLEVGRADVLAAGGDDQLLLAVDDLEVAVVVELADVAGVQPAVVVERLGGLLGLVEVAANTLPPRQQHLAVLGEPHLDAGTAAPTVPALTSGAFDQVMDAGGLRHAVDLRQRHADGAEPARISAGIGAAPVMAISTSSRPSSPRTVWNATSSRKSQVAISSCGGGAASHRLDDRQGRLDRLVELALALSGSAPSAALTPAWIFSQTRGHPEEDVGAHLAAVGGESGRVSGQQVDLVAEDRSR